VNDQRNMVLAVILSALVMIGGTFISNKFYPAPKPVVSSAATSANANAGTTLGATATAAAPILRDPSAALKDSPRILIETPKLQGSLALVGARIDDLVMTKHMTTIKKDAEPIRLLSPAGTKRAYFAGFGWTGEGLAVPGPETLWTASSAKLTPEAPVTLSWDNGQGQTFQIAIAVDKDYMFTVVQSVLNNGTAPVSVRANGYVSRIYGVGPTAGALSGSRVDQDSWTIHVGPIGPSTPKLTMTLTTRPLMKLARKGRALRARAAGLGLAIPIG
jgi:YidC/Oxa1 family membrane protein insertase